jgi:hypothetical protein
VTYKENEMNMASSICRGDMHTKFYSKIWKGKALLRDLDSDGRIMLKLISNKQRRRVYIQMDLDRVQWQVLVNTVMRIQISCQAGNFSAK